MYGSSKKEDGENRSKQSRVEFIIEYRFLKGLHNIERRGSVDKSKYI